MSIYGIKMSSCFIVDVKVIRNFRDSDSTVVELHSSLYACKRRIHKVGKVMTFMLPQLPEVHTTLSIDLF